MTEDCHCYEIAIVSTCCSRSIGLAVGMPAVLPHGCDCIDQRKQPSARSVLAQHRFTPEDNQRFTLGDVSVVLYEDSGVLTRINVRVSTTNKKGLIF